MAEKKRRPYRKEYLNDFYKNPAGEYVYTGAYYRQQGSEAEKNVCRRKLTVETVGIVLAVVLAGCQNAAGMTGSPYVLIPYAAEAIAAFATVWALIRMLCGGDPLRAYIYEKAVAKLPDRAMLLLIFAGASAVGAIIYLILHGFEGKIAGALIYLAMKAAQMILAYDVRHTVRATEWKIDA